MPPRLAEAFQRFDRAELCVSMYLNRSSNSGAVRQFFRAVSWLGDGWLWLAIGIGLPALYGTDGLPASAHMIAAGAFGVAVYKSIKGRAVRERPFITHAAIQCGCAPLDQYSFPSGHTLHAVSFAIIVTHYFPEWGAPLAAFATLVAFSRVTLGLHYPSDVLAGALLGGAIGTASLWLIG